MNKPFFCSILKALIKSASVMDRCCLCRLQVSSPGFGTELVSVFYLLIFLALLSSCLWAAACRGSSTGVQRASEGTTPPHTGERSATGEAETTEPGTKRTHSHIKATSQWSSKDGLHAVFEQHITHQRSQVQVICTSKCSPVCVCSHLFFKTFCLQV